LQVLALTEKYQQYRGQSQSCPLTAHQTE